jgi:hypothetical protein
MGGGGGGVSVNEYGTAVHWSPNNFGDLTPYLTYGTNQSYTGVSGFRIRTDLMWIQNPALFIIADPGFDNQKCKKIYS